MKNKRILQHRNATLKLYQELKKARSEAEKNIPPSVATSHKNLKNNRFLLAIVGKVNAGKSTFINALLKQELLPTDALQATAAIIEIFNSERPFLRVTYANGITDEISPVDGEDHLAPLTQKLRDVAAVQEEERALPFAQLNDFIIDRYNPESKRAEWDETEQQAEGSKGKRKKKSILDHFLQGDLPNIHKLSDAELREGCRIYLENNRNGSTIAKQIEVGIPFPEHDRFDQFDHFRIVDTPGIGAKGGFAERTLEFLINADGVIYLHKEEPSEKTLHDALEKVIPEKVKKHMLLVLTHKDVRDDDANVKFLEEARKCCPQIPREKIFLVDSLTDRALQTYYDFKSWDELVQIRKRDTKTHKAWRKVTANAFEDSEGSRAEFLERLEKQSNMRGMREEILRMSEKSLAIQIETLLGAMIDLFAELGAEAAARADICAQGLKDPEQFAAKMDQLTSQMKQYEAEAKERVSQIGRQFDLANTKKTLGKTLGKHIEGAEAEINGKKFLPEDTAKTADDFLTKIKQDVEDGFVTLSKDVESELRETMKDMQVDLQAKFNIQVPKIPLEDILDRQREESTKSVTVTVKREDFWGRLLQVISFGKAGQETREERRFDATYYFESTRTAMINELGEKKKSFIISVKEQVGHTCDNYQASVVSKIQERQKLIDQIKNEEMDNNSVQKTYESEISIVKAAQESIAECRTIQSDL